jgi:predicted outer membrane lipoprotein
MNSLVPFLEWLVAQLKSSGDKERHLQDANLADQAKKAEEEHKKQQLAHYAATVTAWFNTKMEHDKSLLTLSSAAIGVLVTLVTKFTIQSYAAMSLFVAALACFVICVIAVLAIYKRNSTHLVNLIHSDEENDAWLSFFDWTSLTTFLLGIILASAFGILMAVGSLKETDVAGNDKNGPTAFNDSVNKAIGTRPIDPLTKSFNQAASTKPPTPSTAPPAALPQPAAQTASAPAGGSPPNKR